MGNSQNKNIAFSEMWFPNRELNKNTHQKIPVVAKNYYLTLHYDIQEFDKQVNPLNISKREQLRPPPLDMSKINKYNM